MNKVSASFDELKRMMVFASLEPVYKGRCWVLIDGDEAGLKAKADLEKAFKSESAERFICLRQDNFEHYYPADFQSRAKEVLAITDDHDRKRAKAQLITDVVAWLRQDDARAKAALQESAAEVIAKLQEIAKQSREADAQAAATTNAA